MKRPKLLRRFAAVVLQQSAQALLTANVAERTDRRISWILSSFLAFPHSRFWQQFVPESLVRPFSQIVGQIDGSDAGEMLKSDEEKMVQTLPANRPDEPLGKCLAVRRMHGTAHYLDVLPLQGSVECRRILPIPVVLHVADLQPQSASLLDELLGLSRDPYVAGNQQVDQAPEGITAHVWNYENQETLVVLPSGARVTMSYAADFRRSRKES